METAAVALALVTQGPLTAYARDAIDLLQALDNTIADLEAISRRRARAAGRFNHVASLTAAAMGLMSAAFALPVPPLSAVLAAVAAVLGGGTALKWAIVDRSAERRDEQQIESLRELKNDTAWELVQWYARKSEEL